MAIAEQPQLHFDLSDPEFFADPYPIYRRLRDEQPAYHLPDRDLWVITRYVDVERALTDYRTFSSAKGNAIADLPNRVGKTIGSLDPPRHDELRALIQKGLGPARIEALLPGVRQDIHARLGAFRDLRRCDIVRDVGKPVLFAAIGRILGLGKEESERAAQLASPLFHDLSSTMGGFMRPEAFQAILDFLAEEARKRSGERGEDIISALLDAKERGARISEQEIVANMATVLLAGNAGILHLFSNVLYALWQYPDERRRLLAQPARAMAVIDETARWDTPTQSFARQTTVDVMVSDTLIPADSRVALIYASANRDERVFEDPDRFNPDRRRIRHFGFGGGPHVCIGASVSRSIMRVILQELLPSLGEYELDLARAERIRHVHVRGFVKLPLTW